MLEPFICPVSPQSNKGSEATMREGKKNHHMATEAVHVTLAFSFSTYF